MCRRNYLRGCCALAFGLGLMVGYCLESWFFCCCGGVALICLVATYFVLPALLFTAIMGFLCLVVSVVASVLDAAVALQEENDLTI